LERGAAERQRIDAAVRIKTPVFIGQQQFQVSGINRRLGIDWEPPAAVRHRVGAQQFAVAIDDARGNLARLLQRQRTERDDPSADGADDDDKRKRDCEKATSFAYTNTVMAGLARLR